MTLQASDLTPAQAADSWRSDGCDYCDQTANHRCRTKSGALCPPHTNRRVKYAAFLNGQASRDAEVATLTAQWQAKNDELIDANLKATQLSTDLAAANAQAVELATQLKTARAGAALVPGLQQQVADLLEYKAEHPDVPPPPPPEPVAQVIDLADFAASHTAGVDFGAKSLTGDGATKLVYRMKPKTSTKAALIAAIPKGKSNPYRMLAFGGDGAATASKNLDISGFTAEGTDQGHMYGGVRVGYSVGAHLHDFTVKAIPGDAAGPPGETFSVATYHSDAALLERITVDGRDASGKPAAGTLIGINSSVGTVIRNCVANFAAAGMALAVWDSQDTTVEDFDARNSRHPINFEQAHPGTIKLTRVDMRGQTDGGPHVTVNSNIGSSQVVITDPVVNKWPLRVGISSRPYIGKPQLQKVSDVRLIVGGNDVTADPKYLACGQVW